jgi:hypothetical protein
MRRFVKWWKTGGHEKRLKARIVNYADDFVICCRGTADDAMAVTHVRQSLRYSEVLWHFVPQNAAGNRLCFCSGSKADSGSDRHWYPMRNLWPAYGLAT